jgi:hypothetical protein
MKIFFLVVAALVGITHASPGNATCIVDWGKCGGKNWNLTTICCNTRFFCNKSDPYYHECVPYPLKPFPPAPPSAWCGAEGKTMDSSKLSHPGEVTSQEIGEIWSAATQGLTQGRHPGGHVTCSMAVSIALGECGHPSVSNWKSITDPVCSFAQSGPGGIWQITSQDASDTLLAGCSNGKDPCCNARLAYAHAFNNGGATAVPTNYCQKQKDCTQIYSNPGGTTGAPWNNPGVDQSKPDALIPDCSLSTNPWYPDGGKSLKMLTIDQEPCYFGPFSIAAGGVGKEFFAGFYGWGGFFQHYMDSKAGLCDPSPQAVSLCNPDAAKWADYPNYAAFGLEACAAVKH